VTAEDRNDGYDRHPLITIKTYHPNSSCTDLNGEMNRDILNIKNCDATIRFIRGEAGYAVCTGKKAVYMVSDDEKNQDIPAFRESPDS
jgi:hypothetical protein